MEIKVGFHKNLDLLKFKNLPEERRKSIQESSSAPVKNQFLTNQMALHLHPTFFLVKVKEIIIENKSVKSFLLEPNVEKGTQKLPPFQAGQYLTIEVPIDQALYKRAYSISSSPDDPYYRITIKRVEGGTVSKLFLDQVKVGDEFLCHGPFGDFVYNSIRDANHVIALAGGCGITPIMSMAKALSKRASNFSMDILYAVNREEDLIFKEELLKITEQHSNIHVQFVLAMEEKEGYLHGYITKEMIESIQTEQDSYFVCGPLPFYRSLNEIFKELGVANKYVRHDLYPEYEFGKEKKNFSLTVLTNGEEKVIPCNGTETLLASMEKAGIKAPKKCGVGVCGFCRSKLLEGEVLTSYQYVRKADKKFHYIHPCSTFPLSDVKIRLPK